MKLIVGLGNPGQKYANTRHNIGFIAIDSLASQLKESWKIWSQTKNAELIQTSIGGEKITLVKPLTFMNLSGEAVQPIAQFFKTAPEDICIIHDELDIPFGEIRLKIGGGEGGHNGLASISQLLGTGKYSRIRMGIGRPPHPQIDPGDFVLSPFQKQEWSEVEDMISRAISAIEAFAQGLDSFKKAMNTLNQKTKKD